MGAEPPPPRPSPSGADLCTLLGEGVAMPDTVESNEAATHGKGAGRAFGHAKDVRWSRRPRRGSRTLLSEAKPPRCPFADGGAVDPISLATHSITPSAHTNRLALY